MATKISELNTSVTAVANDLFMTITNTSNASLIESKKITLQGIANSLPGILNISGSGGITVNTTADANIIALAINVSGSNNILVDTVTNNDNIALSMNTASMPFLTSFTITDPETAATYTQNVISNNVLVLQSGRNIGFDVDANNTITLATRELANGVNLYKSSNGTHEMVGLQTNPSITGNTILGSNSGNITTFNSIPILPSVNTTVRDALSAVDGMMIYNIEDTKVQVRAGGAWANIH
jgi:hypothetical protein